MEVKTKQNSATTLKSETVKKCHAQHVRFPLILILVKYPASVFLLFFLLSFVNLGLKILLPTRKLTLLLSPVGVRPAALPLTRGLQRSL